MQTRRLLAIHTAVLLAASAALVSCGSSQNATCAAADVDCFMSHLVVRDATGVAVPVTFIDAAAIASISAATGTSASAPRLTSGPASLQFPYGTQVVDVLLPYRMDLSFADPNGCQPVVGFTLSKGGKKSRSTGCFPGLRDHRTSGSFIRYVGFAADAPDGASFDLDMVTISSAGCAWIDSPLNLITADGAHPLGSPGVAAGVSAQIPMTISVSISPPPAPVTGGTSSCTAAWDCGTSAQCKSVMGGQSGTAGPFASLAACNQWRQTYFAGGVCSSGCH